MKTYFRWLFAIFLLFTSSCNSKDTASDPPYPPSLVIESITWDFANIVRLALGSDLWPVTWASDNNLYVSWGDGVGSGAADFKEQWGPDRASLGFSRIEGPPTTFKLTNVWGGKNAENPATFRGKSAGMLSVDGTLYAWVNLQNDKWPNVDKTLAWSYNLGATWQRASWVFPAGAGNFKPGTFINFGRDYAGARDNFVYFRGQKQGDGNNGYMGRVLKNNLKDRGRYEFYSGLDSKWKS